jgi:four helix bundle protein
MKKYDLEDRLIDFAVVVLTIVDDLPNNYSAVHLGNQLSRSGTAPALNYGEAQAAESSNDFIHKMKICLKELRETSINIKIITKRNYVKNAEILQKTFSENMELIAIFTASINTAKSRKAAK